VEQFLRAGERKFSSTEPPTIWGPTLRQTPVESNLPGFVGFVSHLIAVESLIPDPSPDGGGFRQATTGGVLNVDPHFTPHPYWSSWQRRVNLLELWNPDVVRWVEKITPDTNSDQSAGKVLPLGDSYFRRRRAGS
jgi:hypothetical protein